MKWIGFISLFLFAHLNIQAQFIEGRVLDFKTHEPIVFANVYFNGTIITGSTTNSRGYFSLKQLNQHIPFYVSFIGYQTREIKDYTLDKFLTIYLKPKTFGLPLVELKNIKNYRKKKERIFKREFLGISRLARYSTIENLKDIKLVFSKDKKTLYGYSEKPILINNKYLGYKIKYYLDQFYFRRDTVFFQGSYYFKENKTTNRYLLKKYKRHRRLVYFGSKMHFMRALYNNKLKEERYTVLEGSRLKFVTDSVFKNHNTNYLKIKNFLIIYYRDEEMSKLNQISDSIYISKNGYYDPYSIIWTGYMGNQRIPELLPFDYQPDKN
jgi:CarboxypepD_reg-like domain